MKALSLTMLSCARSAANAFSASKPMGPPMPPIDCCMAIICCPSLIAFSLQATIWEARIKWVRGWRRTGSTEQTGLHAGQGELSACPRSQPLPALSPALCCLKFRPHEPPPPSAPEQQGEHAAQAKEEEEVVGEGGEV